MKQSVEQLVKAGHRYFRNMDAFFGNKIPVFGENTRELLDQGNENPLSKEHMDLIVKHDYDVITGRHRIAQHMLEGISYTAEDAQAFVERTAEFTGHENYWCLGTFITEMLRPLLAGGKEVVLDTKNDSPVFVEEHFPPAYCFPGKRFLGDSQERSKYIKEHALIVHLADNLAEGRLIVAGNVGEFFASDNSGAYVQLDGDAGWRSCAGMKSGHVVINGDVCPELCSGASGGRIDVNGEIHGGIGGYYTPAYGHEIFHNGVLVPKTFEDQCAISDEALDVMFDDLDDIEADDDPGQFPPDIVD